MKNKNSITPTISAKAAKSKLVSVIRFLVLFCLMGGLIPMKSESQSASLLLVNDQVTAVPSTMVSLSANLVYDALGVPEGTPIRVTADGGDILPASLSSNGKTLNILAGLGGSGSIRASVTPNGDWQKATDLIYAHHDSEKLTAMVSNGLLTAVYEDEVFSIYLGSASNRADLASKDQVFENFSLHKIARGDPEYKKETSPEGWTRVYRMDAPPVDVKSTVENGQARITVTHKFIREGTEPILYEEILTLLPSQPIIDYRSVFTNQGTETYYLGSRDNSFTALISGLYNEDMQVVRANGRLVNEGRLGWLTPRWFSAVTKNGYSLCFTALKPGIPGSHYFDFHRANISMQDSNHFVRFGQAGINNGAADAEKWAIFKPGEEEEIGVGIHVFIPGQPVRKIMEENWSKAASGFPMAIQSPLSVYLDGKPVQGGSISSLPDAFSQPESWMPSETAIRNGIEQTTLKASKGKGSVSRAFYVDMDKPFFLRTSLESLSKGASVSITAQEIGSQKVYTLAELQEPGTVDIRFQEKIPWDGLKSFTLGLHLDGKKKCEAILTRTLIGEPPPDAPDLISPLDGVSLTDIAAFYLWNEVKGCGEYEIDISETPGFESPIRHKVILTNPRPYFYPRELLSPGSYYWRVRALQYDRNSTPGVWSEIRHFDLNNEHTVQNPIINISSEAPLITMRGGNWPGRYGIWKDLNEVIKPHFVFRAYPGEGDFYENLERFQEANMKVFYDAPVPFGPTGRVSSLADIEYAYQHYPAVLGSCIGEQFYWYFNNEIEREYLLRHNILAAKYGRFFHWADLHKIGWNELAKRPEYASGEMASVILTLLKTTEPYTAYITQGHIAGWYLARLTNITGTQADIWYWASVGFRKAGENNLGVRQGNHRLIPPVTYLQHWLLAMMQGGTVFANEWGGIAGRNGPNELWTRYYDPFFKGIIEHRMIPTREEYTEATKVIVHGELPEDFPEVERYGFTDPDYGPFKVLYEELYGARDPLTDFIPKNGRYGLIAVLPESVTDFKHEGIQVVSLNDLQTPEQVHETFDPLYPKSYEGDALVLQVGKSVVIMNSNENLDVDQSYEVPFKGDGLVRSMKGSICLHKYIMGKHEEESQHLWLQANVSIVSPEKTTFLSGGRVKEGTYETRNTEISFECSEKPELSWEPKDAQVQSSWNPESGLLKVTLPHDDGAVSITLEKPAR
ncbi:glycoside hydrolase family 98 domain-containing protein [Bacteroidota bacterium]